MADIKLRIEVNPDADTEQINYILRNKKVNDDLSNASIKGENANDDMFKKVADNSTNIFTGISLNDNLYFNDEGVLYSQQKGNISLIDELDTDNFVWGIVPESKEYIVELTISGVQNNLKDIVILGDKNSNQFPTEAIVDGTTPIENDDYKWVIALPTQASSHTIRFKKWNKSGVNAIITEVRVMLRFYDVDKYNGLKEINFQNESSTQSKNVYYGIVYSTGEASIQDVDGELYDMITDGIIPPKNVSIDIIANGTTYKNMTNDSSYNINAKNFSLDFTNKLYLWKNKLFNRKISNFPQNSPLGHKYALYSMLVDCLQQAGYSEYEIDEMMDDNMIHNNNRISVKDYLLNITNESFYLEDNSTIYDCVDKICKFAQLNVFENDNGKIKFVSARSVFSLNDTIIDIPSRMQLGEITTDVILKNTYTGITIPQYNIIETQVVDDSLDKKDLKKDSPGIFVYTDLINLSEQETWGKYNASIYTTSSGAKYLVGYFSENALLNTKYYRISLTSEPFCILVGLDYNGWPSSSTGSEVTTYYSFDDFKQNLYAEKAIFSSGRLYDALDVDGMFNQMTTYFFAIPYTTDLNSQKYNLYYGGDCDCSEISTTSDAIQFGDIRNNLAISENTFFTTTAKIYGDSFIEFFANNILSDYKNGLRTITLSVVCGDYYTTDGNLIINWTNGDMIEIGDILKIDKDNFGNSLLEYQNKNPIYGKVIGRTFKKGGKPSIELTLQECILIDI